MLENYACALLAAREPRERQRYASMAAELCILRYPMCKATILEYVNQQLEQLDITPLKGYASIPELIDKIVDKLVAEGQGRLYAGQSTRELRELRNLALHIFTVAVIAALDVMGVKCPGVKPAV